MDVTKLEKVTQTKYANVAEIQWISSNHRTLMFRCRCVEWARGECTHIIEGYQNSTIGHLLETMDFMQDSTESGIYRTFMVHLYTGEQPTTLVVWILPERDAPLVHVSLSEVTGPDYTFSHEEYDEPLIHTALIEIDTLHVASSLMELRESVIEYIISIRPYLKCKHSGANHPDRGIALGQTQTDPLLTYDRKNSSRKMLHSVLIKSILSTLESGTCARCAGTVPDVSP